MHLGTNCNKVLIIHYLSNLFKYESLSFRFLSVKNNCAHDYIFIWYMLD